MKSASFVMRAICCVAGVAAISAACSNVGGAADHGAAPLECAGLGGSDVTAITGVAVKAGPPPSALSTTTQFCGSYTTADGAPYLSVKRFTDRADYANEIVDVSTNRRLPNPKRDIGGLGLEAVVIERPSQRDRVLGTWDGQHGVVLFVTAAIPEDQLEKLAAKGLSSG